MWYLLLDGGHGVDMKGAKLSPDGRLKEGVYVRDIVKRIERKINALNNPNIKVLITTPEETDISLSERCKRINNWCTKYGTSNCISVSVHVNAAGSDGKWHDANGWLVFVSLNASTNSKRLAKDLYEQAEQAGLKGNRWVPSEKYMVANLAMCRDTKCPAVLTENMFLDNKEDVDFLLSEEGRETIADVHVKGILKYINE